MNLKTSFYLTICVIVYLLLVGCTSEKGNVNNLIQLDVHATYPMKEIKLEDIADIEYLQLEVDEDFLISRGPSIITSDKIIFSPGFTGDFLVFSRDGKPFSKFNRRGNGPEDFIYTTGGSIYDETSDELFVRTHNKMMVYSSSGEFRRVVPLPEGATTFQIVNYDSETLLLYDDQDMYPAPFSFISKEDGSVVETVDMPIGKKMDLTIVVAQADGMTLAYRPVIGHIVRYNDGFLLSDFSNDTIYYLSRKKELSPLLVRKPNIHSMDPIITLSSFVEAGNYEFMFTTRVVKIEPEDRALPRTYLMRDKQTGSVYSQKITFNDYKGKEVNISFTTIMSTSDSRLGLIVLSLTELQEANSTNRLSGRLKELIDNSDEDGNDIYMLLHFK